MTAHAHVLKSDLRHFGLNPDEWIVEAQGEQAGIGSYFIRPLDEDAAPVLSGVAVQESWVSLSVAEF